MNIYIEKKCENIDEIGFETPEIQRKIKESVVMQIVDFQETTYSSTSKYLLNGTISIAINKHTNVKYLIDGQHRMIAYNLLRNKYPDREMMISIDYFFYDKDEDLDKLYKLVNTNSPNDITQMPIDKYRYLNEIDKFITSTYKSYIKETNSPQRPNFNIDIMKEYIMSKNKIDELISCGITHTMFNENILELNKFYDKISLRTPEKFKEWHVKDYEKVLAKIRTFSNKYYLSLYTNYEWIDRIIESVKLNIPYDDINHFSLSYRPKITKALKRLVWNSKTLDGGICYCCLESITYDDFECGHIIPVTLGGTTDATNLKKICRECNNDMGTMHLEKYKELRQNVSKFDTS